MRETLRRLDPRSPLSHRGGRHGDLGGHHCHPTTEHHHHLYPFSGTFQINSLIDTDGKAGADIVVPFVSSGSQGIVMIHDASQSSHFYSFSSFTITAGCNKDGIAGAELFISTPTNNFILTARLSQTAITALTGC